MAPHHSGLCKTCRFVVWRGDQPNHASGKPGRLDCTEPTAAPTTSYSKPGLKVVERCPTYEREPGAEG